MGYFFYVGTVAIIGITSRWTMNLLRDRGAHAGFVWLSAAMGAMLAALPLALVLK